MDAWLEIRVRAPDLDVDELAGRIATEVAAASAGVEIRDDVVVFWVTPQDAEAAAAAARALGEVEIAEAVPEKEWRDAYKRYFVPTRLTRQLVVVPSWSSYHPEPGDLEIHIDPGQAFGTGSHATTRLVLTALQNLADRNVRPRRILDFGTGSGILALGAALLFPEATITAIDNDALAVAAARENAERNQLDGRIEVSGAGLDQLSIEPDLVVANIQRQVLLPAAPELSRLAASAARLVLSGLLSDQLDEVAVAYRGRGWSLEEQSLDDRDPSWGVLVLAR